MNELFNNLEYVKAYVDDLLLISNGNFENHLNKVKIALKKLKAAGFKINTEKSYPLTNKITVDRGKEFLAEFKTLMANDYGIPCNSISVRNPQADAIVE